MSVAPDQAPSVRRPVNLLPAQIVLAVLAVCGLVFAGLGFRAHISAPIPTTDTQVVEPVQQRLDGQLLLAAHRLHPRLLQRPGLQVCRAMCCQSYCWMTCLLTVLY